MISKKRILRVIDIVFWTIIIVNVIYQIKVKAKYGFNLKWVFAIINKQRRGINND